MIFKNENMLVCFVNTNQNPRKIRRLGVFKYTETNNEFTLYELCEVWYRHPEAPNEGNIQLFDWIQVTYELGTKALIRNTINAVNDIKSITELIGISEETKVI